MKKQLNIKLSIYADNRIIIENYEKLLDLSENNIKVDIYTINGKFLKLKQMDNYIIEIYGEIYSVAINE